MNVAVYLICGLIVMLWSVWLFMLWQKKLNYSDTSLFRFILLLLPVAFFIVIVLSDWKNAGFLKADIMGLIGISVGAIFCWLIQVAFISFHKNIYQYIFIASVILNLLLNVLMVILLMAMMSFPLLAVRISAFFEAWRHIDVLKIIWEGLDPEKNEQTVYNLVNKIFIALAIYFPITAVRMWHTSRKFKQLKQEIDALKEELGLEKKESAAKRMFAGKSRSAHESH